MKDLRCSSLFLEPDTSIAYERIQSFEYPWQVLPHIKEIIFDIGATLSEDEYLHPEEGVWISRDAKIAPSAVISGPVIIMGGAEIRHCAFIRGSALVGRGAVLGNSCEIKNSILFDAAQIPHFNYVGDSVLGWRAHLGAGAIISNLKSDKSDVKMCFGTQKIDTYRRKCGAAVGDEAEIGCNSVLCPGAVVGKGATVYPLLRVRGYVPDGSILKGDGSIVKKECRCDG